MLIKPFLARLVIARDTVGRQLLVADGFSRAVDQNTQDIESPCT
jgi:hypothetical protein